MSKKETDFERILDARNKSLLEGLSRPLEISDIDFRVQSIKNGKAVILAYKDARVDMKRLDEVVGAYNWKREHNGAYCTVSIYDSEKDQWISKQDIGTESMTEKEKGLASDSFKRACFNWGIGRELYDYPTIVVELNDWEKKQKQGQGACYPNNWTWFSQFTDGKLSYLAAKDKSGKRFEWGTFKK